MKTVYQFIIIFFGGLSFMQAQCPQPFNINQSGCSGSTKPISAQSYGYDNVSSHRWYTTSSGGSPISGIQQNAAPGSGYYISTLTKTFTASETYYVAAVCSGSESTRVQVKFTLNTAANLIIGVQGGAQEFYCSGETVTLQGSNGSSYIWKNSSGSTIGTGSSVGVTSTGTYTLTGSTGCGGTSTKSITITFKNPSTPNVLSKVPGCGNATITRNNPPVGTGETWYWQTSSTGTVTDGVNANTSWVVSSGSLYLRSKLQGFNVECWGTALPVTYTVGSAPGLATGSDGERCGPGNISLTATPGSGGNTIKWYTSATGGTVLYTGTTYVINNLTGTTDYYAESYSTGISCGAVSRKKITATINPVPEPLVGSIPSNVCYGDTGSISVISYNYDNVSSHKWYTQLTGGTEISGIQLNTDSSSGYYISQLTKAFTSDETYYVATVCDGAESTRLQVNFILNTSPDLSIGIQGGAQEFYCSGETVTLQGSNASNYVWKNSSGSTIGTGFSINVTTSGTYTLTGSTGCGTDTEGITITFKNPSTPNVLSKVPGCGNATITRNNPPAGTGETWYWQTSPSDTETDAVNANTSWIVSSGELYLRSRVAGINVECWGEAVLVNYSVQEAPEPPFNPFQSYCGSGSITLTTSFIPNIVVKWYDQSTGGIPLDTGDSFNTPEITSNVTYYAESFNQVSGCTSDTRTPFEVNYGVQPQNVFGPNVSFCDSSNVTLEVNLPSNTDNVQWYTNSDDDTPIATGLSYTTPIISETTTYYVEGVNSTGCVSSIRRSIQAIFKNKNIWYLDQDGDGLGDINYPSELICEVPPNHVGNSDDACPYIKDLTNTCNQNPDTITGDNYVYTRTYQTERTDATNFFTADDELIQQITYFDGLGRPIQQNAIRQSPNDKKDIITHISYDEFGRMEKEWLPFHDPTGSLGAFRTDDMAQATYTYYQNNYGDDFPTVINPYSQKMFESSPLNWVLKQAAPGEAWKLNPEGDDHAIEFGYETNTIADEVRQLTVTTVFANNTYTPTLDFGTDGSNPIEIYAPGELYKNVTKDENHTGTTKNHTTEEFTDKQGRTILKRTYADTGAQTEVRHDTYYVYNAYGNFSYVLPPKMEASLSTRTITDLRNDLDALGYQYIYDHRNRLVEKQIPGKKKEYIIYNKLDQPIMTQDANQREDNEWLFTKYDVFGRVAYTGKAVDSRERHLIQKDDVDVLTTPLWVVQGTTNKNAEYTENINIYYDNGAYPTNTISEVLTVNYYDSYVDEPSGAPQSITILEDPNNATEATNVKGLATVSRVKVLDQIPAKWINTLTYYDAKGRPVYTYSENEYLETIDIAETQLDFIGKPLKSKTTHIRDNEAIITIDNFTYDHVGRLLAQTQCVGDATMGDSCSNGTGSTATANINITSGTITTEQVASNSITVTNATLANGAHLSIDIGSGGEQELIVFNEYDNLGQLKYKKVGGTPNLTNLNNSQGLQQVDYVYNVRGWLKVINEVANIGTDLFSFKIGYNEGINALYNGNISITQWRTANQDNTLKTYDYTYDPLNRITAATDNTGKFNLSGVTYDKNGNIQTLKREGWTVQNPSLANNTGFGTMDDLTYSYQPNSNKLAKVADAATIDQYGFKDDAVNTVVDTADDYSYDLNGNMISDANKGITDIEYNYLNMPTKITVAGSNAGALDYVYAADRTKLRKINNNGTTTDYIGNYVYENDKFAFFSQPEGYVEPKNSDNLSLGFDYIYQYKDHLGNIRLSYKDVSTTSTPSLEIQEENNYYPFGLKHKGYNGNVTSTNRALKFKYQGQELEEGLGYEMYEFELRHYDAAIGRFVTTDPYEQFQSPYLAMGNNPVIAFDPDGGLCYDANGNSIACPDGGDYDQYRDSETEHINILDEVVLTPEDSNKDNGLIKIVPDKFAPITALSGFEHAIAEIEINLTGSRTVETPYGDAFADADGNIVRQPLQGSAGGLEFIGNPTSALKVVASVRSIVKGAKLPIFGKIRFIPRPSDAKSGRLLKKNGGYVDKFGNIWKKGPSRTKGQAFEWDVQLSAKGKAQLGGLSRDGKHLNVSLDGKVTH